MATASRKRRRRGPGPGDERCFLCGEPLAPEDREAAYERVLPGGASPAVDRAHAECASEAGLWEGGEDGEEERPRARG